MLFFAVLMLCSCREKQLDDLKIDFFEGEKLVIDATMYAGALAVVKLSKTIPILADTGANNSVPIGGTVKLMQNGLELERLVEIAPGYFVGSQARFQAGQAYYFEASVPGFSTITSIPDTIPSYPSVQLNAIQYALDSSSRKVNFSFQDLPSNNDIYFLSIAYHFNNKWTAPAVVQEDVNTLPYLSGLNTLSYPCKSSFVGTNAMVLRDLCGQEYIFNMQYVLENQAWEHDSNYNAIFYDIDSVKIILEHVSITHYNYRKSLADHNIAQDDPFSDVVPIRFNVNGGYGIAAGIAKDSILVRLY